MSYSHEWGVQQQKDFGLAPWGPGKTSGQKVKFIKLQLQSLFHRFLYQTFCVFIQIKDINVSKDIFVLMPGSCIRGGT